jgi:hypothetical protein
MQNSKQQHDFNKLLGDVGEQIRGVGAQWQFLDAFGPWYFIHLHPIVKASDVGRFGHIFYILHWHN